MFHRQNSLILTMIVLLTLGTASAASAGGSIFAGADFPTGKFADGAKTGWTIGGYYTGNVTPLVDIGGYLGYNNWSADAGAIPEEFRDFDSSIDAWELHLLGQLSFLMLNGYLGLGFANYNINLDDMNDSSRLTDFSWQIGLSVDFAMLEASLAYHQIPVEEHSINWMSLTLGLKF